MPPAEDKSATEGSRDTTASTPNVGIIYPPPEVRNIVDKTASFVARNGPEFETRIRQNELNNAKFNFLNTADPFYAYYQHKVKDFKEGKGQEPVAPSLKGVPLGLAPTQKQQEQAKIIEAARAIPKEPPAEFEFIADPPSISAFDLDVVKLTAQFVARNGRQFLTNLMNRELRNFQFDFLRPQHSLFNYFTKLVEQYTKILIPPKDLLPKLRKQSETSKVSLEGARYRVDWIRYQEREKQKEEQQKERERVAYASIDWHDFVVVEIVDFQPNETGNLPPPTTPEEVGARVIAQERYHERTVPADNEAVEMDVESSDDEDEVRPPRAVPTPHAPDDIQVQDMEEDSGDEEEGREKEPRPPGSMAPPPPPPLPVSDKPQPPPLPPTPDQVIIKKDYNPKAPKMTEAELVASDKFLVSPITGEKIPADKIQEHMRIGLLDPKWLEQRDRSGGVKRDQEEVYALGSSIGSSLRQLAERRTDIFGVGIEETQIGKKIGEEEHREKNKIIWDGHTASMEKVTQKARQNISIEDQIAVIHKVKGLVPDEEKEKIGPAMPKSSGAVPAPPPPPPMGRPQPPHSVKPPLPAPVTAKNQPPGMPGSQLRHPMPPPPRPPGSQMMMPMGQPPHHGGRPPMPPGMMGMQPPQGGYRPRLPMGGPSMLPPPRPPMPPPPQSAPGWDDDEPPSKKAKTEDNLIPENIFLAKNKGPVTFKVQVPKMPDKSEWKLNGQTLGFTLPLTDNVSVIKAKLHESLGMPAGKQKLQFEGLFIKDSNTLAFYNFNRNSAVQLQLKERGGRKK